MIHTFLSEFSTPEIARYFQATLFREIGIIARVRDNAATVNFRTCAELERIGEIARMFD